MQCMIMFQEMPIYQTGDSFEPSSIEMLTGETSPPPLLTEADLIALMEKHGIGNYHVLYKFDRRQKFVKRVS